MKALLRKEFTLSLFPLPYCFWLLAGLLLIPNYPYFVTFSTPRWVLCSCFSITGRIGI